VKRATFIATDDTTHYSIAEGTHDYCIGTYMDGAGYRSDRLYGISEHARTPDILSALNRGRAIVTYSGHGSPDSWMGPVFRILNIRSLLTGKRSPWW